MKTKFFKETDKKGRTYIIEGRKMDFNILSIERFICEVQEQETKQATQELADKLLKLLNANPEALRGE